MIALQPAAVLSVASRVGRAEDQRRRGSGGGHFGGGSREWARRGGEIAGEDEAREPGVNLTGKGGSKRAVSARRQTRWAGDVRLPNPMGRWTALFSKGGSIHCFFLLVSHRTGKWKATGKLRMQFD